MHSRTLAKMDRGARLFYASRQRERAAEYAKRYGGTGSFGRYEDALADERVEVAVVVTPPASHLELLRLALASGRHVLCEKPLVTSASELFELGRLLAAHDRLLGCCTSRYMGFASTEQVRGLMRSGALGNVYHATFVHRTARSRAGIEYQPSSRWFLKRADHLSLEEFQTEFGYLVEDDPPESAWEDAAGFRA